jgi:hypothetical protein
MWPSPLATIGHEPTHTKPTCTRRSKQPSTLTPAYPISLSSAIVSANPTFAQVRPSSPHICVRHLYHRLRPSRIPLHEYSCGTCAYVSCQLQHRKKAPQMHHSHANWMGYEGGPSRRPRYHYFRCYIYTKMICMHAQSRRKPCTSLEETKFQ